MPTELSPKEKARRKQARDDARWLKERKAHLASEEDVFFATMHELLTMIDYRTSADHPADVKRRMKLLRRDGISSRLLKLKPMLRELERALGEIQRGERRAELARWCLDHPEHSLAELRRVIPQSQDARDAYDDWQRDGTPMPAKLFEQASQEAQQEAA